MEQYINKSALVAEIERRIKRFREEKDSVSIVKTNTYKGLLSFLDTLDVKEVDFADEASIRNELAKYIGSFSNRDFVVAKHFFSLGLKAAQKGE